MHSHCGSITTVICAALGATVQTAAADDLPANRCVGYLMRADPNDPNSPLAFVVTLTLSASSASGDSVGWSVTGAEFAEFGEYGVAITVWYDDQPNVDTPDGLWWVSHANPGSPQASEFALPPLLSGSAIAQDPGSTDLDFAFSGVAYDPSPGDPPYAATAALNYAFVLAGESQPLRAGESEPVEIDDERDPPTSGQLVACGAADRLGDEQRPYGGEPCEPGVVPSPARASRRSWMRVLLA